MCAWIGLGGRHYGRGRGHSAVAVNCSCWTCCCMGGVLWCVPATAAAATVGGGGAAAGWEEEEGGGGRLGLVEGTHSAAK